MNEIDHFGRAVLKIRVSLLMKPFSHSQWGKKPKTKNQGSYKFSVNQKKVNP